MSRYGRMTRYKPNFWTILGLHVIIGGLTEETAMRLAVLGCGMMGVAAIYDLSRNPDITEIVAADIDLSKAQEAKIRLGDERIRPVAVDVNDLDDVRRKLNGSRAVLGAVHYKHNYDLSKIAIELGAHYCDLGGNTWVVDRQISLDDGARRAGISIIPDCGLAPGMVAVVVAHGAQRFDSLTDVRIRVGGLPQNPRPPLDYALAFSVDGLINEYVEPARVIRNGKLEEIPSLTELEELSFLPGFARLEAFITSGGTSTLVNTFLGKADNLDYKTIRYPGHCEKIRTLKELGFFSSQEMEIGELKLSPREFSGAILRNALLDKGKDCVLVLVKLKGISDGRARDLSYRLVDHYDDRTELSAMMRTTAFPAAIIMQMQADGRIDARGTVPQEIAVPSDEFLDELAARGIRFEETWSEE